MSKVNELNLKYLCQCPNRFSSDSTIALFSGPKVTIFYTKILFRLTDARKVKAKTDLP